MEINGYEIGPGVDLRYANLEDANLRGADLNGAKIMIGNITVTVK